MKKNNAFFKTVKIGSGVMIILSIVFFITSILIQSGPPYQLTERIIDGVDSVAITQSFAVVSVLYLTCMGFGILLIGGIIEAIIWSFKPKRDQ